MTDYPTGLDTFTAVDPLDMSATTPHSQRHTDLQEAVAAIQAALGTSPAGSWESVKARIAAIEQDSRWTDQRTPLDNSVTSAKIVAGTIVDSDINASAAIAQSKVSGLVTNLAAKASKVTVGASSFDPIIYSATSPLSAIVPAFAGQRCLVDPSNAANVGAREWVATNGLSSGWVVSDGDTGWYNISTAFKAALAAASAKFVTSGLYFSIWIRRRGTTVNLRVYDNFQTDGTAVLDVAVANAVTTGFGVPSASWANYCQASPIFGRGSASAVGLVYPTTGNTLAFTVSASNPNNGFQANWETTVAWPTVAPV